MTPDDLFKRPYPDENYVPPSEADLRRQALQRAYEIAQSITSEQARAAEAAANKPPVDWGPRLRTLNAVLAVGVALWLVAAPPDWLPRSAKDQRTAQQRSLGLRFTLAMEASRINAFRDREGRLPETLAEAGGDARLATYVVVDPTRYTLSAVDGAASLSYDSTQPIGALMAGEGSAR